MVILSILDIQLTIPQEYGNAQLLTEISLQQTQTTQPQTRQTHDGGDLPFPRGWGAQGSGNGRFLLVYLVLV